ncbi:hypothetical protein H920_15841 [Fukomys damarensis]|uniref:Uncharacterized protein n=1 Tax=Fukomys damarensis TaxID=885580 RepID=A0A091CX16_FUKDA|nr:hypothetical protein H920_15841 [Fukomys damarensis]
MEEEEEDEEEEMEEEVEEEEMEEEVEEMGNGAPFCIWVQAPQKWAVWSLELVPPGSLEARRVCTGPDHKPGDGCRPAERLLRDTGAVSSSTRVPESGIARLPAPPRGRGDGKGHRFGSSRDMEAAGTAQLKTLGREDSAAVGRGRDGGRRLCTAGGF